MMRDRQHSLSFAILAPEFNIPGAGQTVPGLDVQSAMQVYL
jgi:hypothetical protein